MVGSSANAICVLSTGFSTPGGGGGGSSTCGGGGGWTIGEVGGGGGGVIVAIVGRPPVAPGINEKSSAREDDIHGTCSPREARVTPTRVRLSVSSAVRSGTRISFRSSWTKSLCSPPLSEITEDSAAEYITSMP